MRRLTILMFERINSSRRQRNVKGDNAKRKTFFDTVEKSKQQEIEEIKNVNHGSTTKALRSGDLVIG